MLIARKIVSQDDVIDGIITIDYPCRSLSIVNQSETINLKLSIPQFAGSSNFEATIKPMYPLNNIELTEFKVINILENSNQFQIVIFSEQQVDVRL